MREIKFRGFRKDIGWKYGYYYVDKHGGEFRDTTIHYIHPIDEEYISYDINKETIGQYTDLKDKNGKEIYEGDIVRGKIVSREFKGSEDIDVIKWGDYLDGEYVFNVSTWLWKGEPLTDLHNSTYGHDKYKLEVIGNIYENPELLESGNG